MSSVQRPAAVGHIAISLPDVDAGMEWYQEIFGFRPITEVGDGLASEGGYFADQLLQVFGPEMRHVRVGHLETANGAAVELFEFKDPKYEKPDDNFAYWRGGMFHLCFIDPDVEGLSQKIIDNGGRARTDVLIALEGQPFKVRFCEDPWGTVLEIMSHPHTRIFSNQA
jgi:catechol 2,3-dioxygenase-like lactoylglutathione lyase family enzyme